jgi:hypothetical protein
MGIEQFDQFCEVGKRSGQPIDLIDHDDVDLSGSNIVQQPLQVSPSFTVAVLRGFVNPEQVGLFRVVWLQARPRQQGDLDAPIANPKPERVATLLIALTAGGISWDDEAGSTGDFDWSKTNAVPRQLSGVFREEPQWVDLRAVVQREHLRNSLSRGNSEFMRAVAQLAAPIRGIAGGSGPEL